MIVHLYWFQVLKLSTTCQFFGNTGSTEQANKQWRHMPKVVYLVSKVKFNPPCFILNKRSQPNDILCTDRTKQVECMGGGGGNRQERDTHSLYMQHHQMAKFGWDACTMLCVQNDSLPSKRQHNWCLMLKRQGPHARIRWEIYYSITFGNDTS
jgi:hypothetical protein